MPKSPRAPQGDLRHNPLASDYSAEQPFKQKAPKKRSRRDEGDEERFIDTKASRKILKIGQDLVDEDEEERLKGFPKLANPAFGFESRFGGADGDGEEEDGREEDAEEWGDVEEEVEIEEIDANDLEAFHKFIPPSFDDPILRPGEDPPDGDGGGQTINLADLILQKIAEHEAEQGTTNTEPQEPQEEDLELPPMAVEVYTQVGHILSRYKSGKLPKPFKLLPTLPPQMLGMIIPLTHPESWTPNSIYEATKLFISSNSVVSQQFLTTILLDRVREDIAENRKLNTHLFKAVERSLYKPKEFFKGFLFPLVTSGSCTLLEAKVVSSAMMKKRIPVLHSAYALARLCEISAEQMSMNTESGGATNVFIKSLLEKRYALPYQTIDALVFHFLRFRPLIGDHQDQTPHNGSGNGVMYEGIEGRLPVIWHQCLLAFAQRYRDEITEDQREALLDLLLQKGHSAIGPEVRRELLAGRGRGVVVEGKGPDFGGDDTMMAG
ncbi:Bystin-domain-containing protein [Tothia fuscella]|uniref:Bystin-domain-containing protein n=1 Tax=Tothia fuscella TaxID=1048955 RepID=A0A9P4TUL3_9PEZI|nr:Bystin-domain-containing protein [Tothia fuscella]